MLKFISQALLLTVFTGTVPVDAVQFEQIAREGTSVFAPLPLSRKKELYSRLPESEKRAAYPVKKIEDSFGITTTARSAIVVDRDTGAVLFAKEPDQVRSIGSVTKLASVMVFLDTNPDLQKMVTLNQSDIVYGGRIYLQMNEALRLGDVLAAAVVGSDNSATKSLIRFSNMTEEEFIEKMNEKAREIGMQQTVFADTTGLSSRNRSTAREIVLLLKEAQKYPEIQTFATTQAITIAQGAGTQVRIENTNWLLRSYLNEGEYKIEVGKTGYLPEAGFVLASSVQQRNHGVHVVVMGAESLDARASEAKGLAGWAFNTFEWSEL